MHYTRFAAEQVIPPRPFFTVSHRLRLPRIRQIYLRRHIILFPERFCMRTTHIVIRTAVIFKPEFYLSRILKHNGKRLFVVIPLTDYRLYGSRFSVERTNYVLRKKLFYIIAHFFIPLSYQPFFSARSSFIFDSRSPHGRRFPLS